MRANGRARVNARNPRAFAICDNCGGLWNHDRLTFQMRYNGAILAQSALLVCPKCKDKPNPNLRAIRISADPTPVLDPRPQTFSDYSGDGRPTDGPVRLVYAGGPSQIYDPTLPPGSVVRASPDFDPVDPNESELFGINFTRFVGSMPIDYALWSVETLTGGDQFPNEKALGQIAINGATVTHRMGGFVGGCTYKVTCTAMTPTGYGYTIYSQFACNALA